MSVPAGPSAPPPSTDAPAPGGSDPGRARGFLRIGKAWTDLRLAVKIPLLVVAAAIVSGLGSSLADYAWASRQLVAVAEEKLLGLLQMRAVTIGSHVASLQRDVRLQAVNPVVGEALVELAEAYRLLGADAEDLLHQRYVEGTPEPRRSRLDGADDGSAYGAAHQRIHPRFRDFIESHGYDDLLLVGLEGRVLYSVEKRSDFASDLAADEVGGLARAYLAARDNVATGREAFVDFAAYDPAGGMPTGFLAVPVYSAERSPVGFLVLGIPADSINSVMQAVAGLGQTGEALIVGPEGLLRGSSRLESTEALLHRQVSIDVLANGFEGESGLAYGEEAGGDGRTTEVLVAYTPLDVLGARWVVAVKSDVDEVYAPARAMGGRALVNGISIAAVVAVIGFAVTMLSIVRPINAVAGALDLMRRGERDAPLRLPSRGDEIGDVSRALVTLRDSLIAQDRLAEERQREALQAEAGRRFQAIAEASPVALLVIGIEDGTVRFASPVARNLLGLERDGAVEGELAAFFATRDAFDRVREAVIGNRADNLETTLLRRGGGVVPVALSARILDYDGVPSAVIGLIDLTQIQEAQAEISQQREKLYQSERLSALGSLLAGVAHELNNPLSVVVAQATLLEEIATDAGTIKRGARIRGAAERCARIVKTFLAMARQRPPSRSAVNLNDLVEAALELLGYGLRTADLKVTTDLAPDLPVLSADPDQLSQVITNLIVNAQQALADREGPRLLDIVTRFDSRTGMVRLSVSDNGPGVPSALRARIFEPFFTTKAVGMGTGIGLSVCYGIVASHRGTIEVGDSPAGGAAFIVLLPAGGEVATATADRTSAPVPPIGRRILVVDDEPAVAEALADILAGNGYRIDVAASGTAALAMVAADDYDAMVSDVRMPDMDGMVLYRGLRDIRPELAGRLVMVTGDTLSPSVEAFLAETGLPCIEKPFTPTEIRRIVAEAIAAAGKPTA